MVTANPEQDFPYAAAFTRLTITDAGQFKDKQYVVIDLEKGAVVDGDDSLEQLHARAMSTFGAESAFAIQPTRSLPQS